MFLLGWRPARASWCHQDFWSPGRDDLASDDGATAACCRRGEPPTSLPTSRQPGLPATSNGRRTATCRDRPPGEPRRRDARREHRAGHAHQRKCICLRERLGPRPAAAAEHPAPGPMRAPGEAQGNFALDELSYRLGMDPLELRLRNYAEVQPQSVLPRSSKALRECYQVGAERWGTWPTTAGRCRTWSGCCGCSGSCGTGWRAEARGGVRAGLGWGDSSTDLPSPLLARPAAWQAPDRPKPDPRSHRAIPRTRAARPA